MRTANHGRNDRSGKKKLANTRSNLGINLSAVVYQEDCVWLAHCLELDIVAEGKSAADAIRSLISLCDLQIRVALDDGDLGAIFRPAPPDVWTLFATGKELVVSERKSRHRKGPFTAPVNRFEAREMAFA